EFLFFFQAEDGIRDFHVTGVQTCALPILASASAWQLFLLGGTGEYAPILGATVVGLAGWMASRLMTPATDASDATRQSWYDASRSEERRVGKECRSRWSAYH